MKNNIWIKDNKDVIDINTKLLESRIVFIDDEIEDILCSQVIAQLLFLDSIGNEDIKLYINSPGGVVTSGLGIIDTMNFVKSDVSTYCFGQACSMGALILSSGKKGKRFSLPNSRIMIHQPLGGACGQATDIEIQTREILKIKKQLNGILSKNTGKPLSQIENDTERDYYLSAIESVEYGLIDSVIGENNDK